MIDIAAGVLTSSWPTIYSPFSRFSFDFVSGDVLRTSAKCSSNTENILATRLICVSASVVVIHVRMGCRSVKTPVTLSQNTLERNCFLSILTNTSELSHQLQAVAVMPCY